jgi:hypothetical protein
MSTKKPGALKPTTLVANDPKDHQGEPSEDRSRITGNPIARAQSVCRVERSRRQEIWTARARAMSSL